MFLFVIVYATFHPYSEDFYLLRSRFEMLFGDQFKMTQARQFWDFAEGKMLDGIYWEQLYNKGIRKNPLVLCPTGEVADGPCPVLAIDRNVMYENRMLGVPRWRQLRVGNRTCTIDKNFKKAIQKCFAPYSEANEDRQDIVKPHRKFTDEHAWKYQTEEQLGGSKYDGKVFHQSNCPTAPYCTVI